MRHGCQLRLGGNPRVPILSGALGLALLGTGPYALLAQVSIEGVTLVALTAPVAEAQAAAYEKKPTALPPEVEKGMTNYFARLTATKVQAWRSALLREVEEIENATALSDERKQALIKASWEAVDRCVKAWTDEDEKVWRRAMQSPSMSLEDMLRMVDQMNVQLQFQAIREFSGDYHRPTEDEIWLGALQRTLNPEQTAAWQKVLDARAATKEKEANEIGQSSAEGMRESMRAPILIQVAKLKSALGLGVERAGGLDELWQRALDEAVDAYRMKAAKHVKSLSDDLRKQILQSGDVEFGWEESDFPTTRAVWKEGLQKFLTDEERHRLAISKEETHARRAQVFGSLLLAEFDGQVAFTSAQREKLQPIAERLAKGQSAFFPEEGDVQINRNYALSWFYELADKTTTEDRAQLMRILDAIQWKRWQAVTTEAAAREKERQSRRPSPLTREKTALPVDPEELEIALAEFLAAKSAIRQKQLLEPFTLQAEDLLRVTGASPETRKRLHAAARGAVELMLPFWKAQIEATLRANLDVTDGLSVRRELSNLESFNYNAGSDNQDQAQAMWDKSVRAELTQKQLAAWKAESGARSDYRNHAIVAAILLEFEEKVGISQDQWRRLEPKILRTLKDCAPDIARNLLSDDFVHWYLQAESRFTPCAAIAEAEMKDVLTKEQWELWAVGHDYKNAVNSWTEIQFSHDERVKNEKAHAARGKP